MVAEGVILHHLHRLQLLESGLLADLVLSFISIMLKVTDIGDIADIAHFIAEVPEQLEQHVVGHSWAGVAKMSVTINGRPADIHSHMAFMDRLEKFLILGKSIRQK